MRMPLLNHMFEYLVPVRETVLRVLRGVALLEECRWGVGFEFSIAQPFPVRSLSVSRACAPKCKLSATVPVAAYCHACPLKL